MATINFKSVGVTSQTQQSQQTTAAPLPIGIKTPMSLAKDSLLEMHYDASDQIADNLKNLLLTNWGERVGHYFFGANLRPLTAEFVNLDNFDSEAVVRIKDAVLRWMPFVDLMDFVSETNRTENKSTGIINVTISYNIQQLNVFGRKLQIVLYVM